jgi:hypothetical protein
MRVNPVTIKIKIGEDPVIRGYTYLADDFPSVAASNLGFLLVVVNSGGKEGSVTYNYVIPKHGILTSIGTAQTTLHPGKVENIEVRPNKKLTKTEINGFIKEVVECDHLALSDPKNAYPVAILLLLGNGQFLAHEDRINLSPLIGNDEISDDPVLLRAIKNVLGPGVTDGGHANRKR